MARIKQIEVLLEDRTPHKWIVALTEDTYNGLITNNNNNNNKIINNKVFGEGSLYSPMLFGKYFDPSDAFPLWDFEADLLLANLRSNGFYQVDWGFNPNDKFFYFKSELPGVGEDMVQVCIEKGKILEISGQYRKHQHRDPNMRDWKSTHWWEHGFVRRIELPENADWKKTEVTVKNDFILEIKIPMKSAAGSPTQSGGSSD